MKKITFVLTILFFSTCKSPDIEYTEYKRTVSSGAIEQILNEYKATDDIYSLLFFKQAFKGEIIQIENCNEIIFSDSLFTQSGLGLAKVFRINNTCTTKITDIEKKYSFRIKTKDASKHKYIYIRKTFLDNNKYKIIFSNSIRGFL